jgi:hypothetical protein
LVGVGVEEVDLREVELVEPAESELEGRDEGELLSRRDAEVDPGGPREGLRVVLVDRASEELGE